MDDPMGKIRGVLDFFKTAIGILHGVGSLPKALALAIIFALTVLWIVIAGVLDIAKTFKEKREGLVKAEEKFPRFFGVLYGGKVRFFLLAIVILLLAIDWRDATTISPPIVMAPPAPNVQFIEQQTLGNTRNKSAGSPPQPVATTPSQPAPFSPPTQAPQKQAFSSAPSAYAELLGVNQKIQDLTDDWGRSSSLALRIRSQLAPPEAQRQVELEIARVDDRTSREWEKMQPEVRKAHEDAVQRMRLPGKAQWSPKQVMEDEGKFSRAIREAEVSPLSGAKNMADIEHTDKFKAIRDYLGDLGRQLANYPENPMPPQ
jgi:hypothetical protein